MPESVSKTSLVTAVARGRVVELKVNAENPSFWTLYSSETVFFLFFHDKCVYLLHEILKRTKKEEEEDMMEKKERVKKTEQTRRKQN